MKKEKTYSTEYLLNSYLNTTILKKLYLLPVSFVKKIAIQKNFYEFPLFPLLKLWEFFLAKGK